MAFIDLFNYKKYFATDSDSQVSRVGHVNQLARRITEPTVMTQEITSEPITCNAYCAKINMNDISTETPYTLEIYNNLVKDSSLVLVSVGSSTLTINWAVTSTVFCSNGFMTITIVNTSTENDLNDPFVNFLIIK
jgi:hypothetical protein